MKFRVKVGEFLNGLDPAFIVATKGVVREFPSANLVTVEALDGCINVYATGGRMSISNEISKNTSEDLRYDCQTQGKFTVRVPDIKGTLMSFDPANEIWVELRAYKGKPDDAAPADGEAEGEPAEAGAVQQLSGMEVVCTLTTDEEQFQTMPCFREYISMPQAVVDLMEPVKAKAKGALEPFKVRRDVFIYATNKILFARGFEESNEKYMYWVIRAQKNNMRFIAGTGPRFAVLDIEGIQNHEISNVKGSKNLLMPNDQTQPILEVLAGARSTTNNETLTDFANFYTNDKWLIIESGHFRMAVAGYQPDIEWPDENQVLGRKNTLVFTTKISDWSNVVRGISATFDTDMKKMHDIHYATMDINFKKGEIAAKTDGMMKSNRKIPIQKSNVTDTDLIGAGSLAFTCVSKYIAEAIKYGSDDECIQVEMTGARQPVIFRYHADSQGTVADPLNLSRPNNLHNINERFSIFFAPKKKQDN